MAAPLGQLSEGSSDRSVPVSAAALGAAAHSPVLSSPTMQRMYDMAGSGNLSRDTKFELAADLNAAVGKAELVAKQAEKQLEASQGTAQGMRRVAGKADEILGLQLRDNNPGQFPAKPRQAEDASPSIPVAPPLDMPAPELQGSNLQKTVLKADAALLRGQEAVGNAALINDRVENALKPGRVDLMAEIRAVGGKTENISKVNAARKDLNNLVDSSKAREQGAKLKAPGAPAKLGNVIAGAAQAASAGAKAGKSGKSSPATAAASADTASKGQAQPEQDDQQQAVRPQARQASGMGREEDQRGAAAAAAGAAQSSMGLWATFKQFMKELLGVEQEKQVPQELRLDLSNPSQREQYMQVRQRIDSAREQILSTNQLRSQEIGFSVAMPVTYMRQYSARGADASRAQQPFTADVVTAQIKQAGLVGVTANDIAARAIKERVKSNLGLTMLMGADDATYWNARQNKGERNHGPEMYAGSILAVKQKEDEVFGTVDKHFTEAGFSVKREDVSLSRADIAAGFREQAKYEGYGKDAKQLLETAAQKVENITPEALQAAKAGLRPVAQADAGADRKAPAAQQEQPAPNAKAVPAIMQDGTKHVASAGAVGDKASDVLTKNQQQDQLQGLNQKAVQQKVEGAVEQSPQAERAAMMKNLLAAAPEAKQLKKSGMRASDDSSIGLRSGMNAKFQQQQQQQQK